MSAKKEKEIKKLEAEKATQLNVKIEKRIHPFIITLPYPEYKFYNKAVDEIIYSRPQHAIYWAEDGNAVKTYKKNANWYLRGVGGLQDFEREGLTWNLVASKIKMRYLPEGYIFDNSAPCGFLKEGISKDE